MHVHLHGVRAQWPIGPVRHSSQLIEHLKTKPKGWPAKLTNPVPNPQALPAVAQGDGDSTAAMAAEQDTGEDVASTASGDGTNDGDGSADDGDQERANADGHGVEGSEGTGEGTGDDDVTGVPRARADSIGGGGAVVMPFEAFTEFDLLEKNAATEEDLPAPVGMLMHANRYRNVLPNSHSRVELSQVGDDVLTTYINANCMRSFEGTAGW